MKKLLNLWTDSTNHANAYYIKKPDQITLSTRLVKQKPISDIIRKPRSITEKNDFKANELRSFLLYYLRFALPGLLPQKFIKHFNLFSNAIYDLLRSRISLQTIEKTDEQLLKFVDDFEFLYGKSNVTLNLHLMRHLTTCVRNLGPLWAHSAFGFEANNGVVCKSITSKKDILHQLSWKYAMNHTIKSSKPSNASSIREKKVIRLTDDERNLFIQKGFELSSDRYFTIYRSLFARGVELSSIHSKEKQTIDYFVRIGDTIGCIHFFSIFDSDIYALIEQYEIIDKIDHFINIRAPDSEGKKVIRFEDVDKKLLYLKFGINEYVVSLPNKYEKL